MYFSEHSRIPSNSVVFAKSNCRYVSETLRRCLPESTSLQPRPQVGIHSGKCIPDKQSRDQIGLYDDCIARFTLYGQTRLLGRNYTQICTVPCQVSVDFWCFRRIQLDSKFPTSPIHERTTLEACKDNHIASGLRIRPCTLLFLSSISSELTTFSSYCRFHSQPQKSRSASLS